jgi:uncharacterized protein YndB with AHSA1/START domain
MSGLELTAEGDREILAARRFAAPPEAVYRAHLDPELIPRWLLGPEGWTMPVCVCDARPGGMIRYEWANGAGGGFYLTGAFVALEPFHRIVHVERMHLPETTPDNHVETRFVAEGDGVLMTMRMTLAEPTTRDMMVASGMAGGMEASYARLERLIL